MATREPRINREYYQIVFISSRHGIYNRIICNFAIMNIAVAGTGYVGLCITTLLAQHNHVTAVDVIPEKVDLINHKQSPIQDEYIEKNLAEKNLDITTTLDGASACRQASAYQGYQQKNRSM